MLSGKVMFRDVYFINEDMSIRYTTQNNSNSVLFIEVLFMLHCFFDTLLIPVASVLRIFSLFIGYIPSLFTLLVTFFQNSRWFTYISLVEDVQPQTETTWSVQKHNKQPTKIVTDLCCCFRDMFNHNINSTNFVHVFYFQ